MKSGSRSTLRSSVRIQLNLAIMIIGATFLVFVAIVGLLLQDKVRMKEKLSRQSVDPANTGDSLDPTKALNAAQDSSTNLMAPLPPPADSVDGTN